jgi:hypothetical protein
MAPIPDPIPGLIFRYGYLWLQEFKQKRVDPSKDRPACIVMQVADKVDPSLKTVDATAIAPGDVIILPITTQPPRPGDVSIELTADEKRLCRLDPEAPSWLIVSEFNADVWPNADLSLIPGINQFAYGIAPHGLMRRIGQKFADARRTRSVLRVKR